MKFRTEIMTADAPKILSPERLAVLTGSCFSDNIGARMKGVGWPAEVNPCGVIYNPVSMAVLYQLALTHRPMRREIVGAGLTRRDGRYVSWLMGSKIAADTAEECIDAACECLDRLERGIESASAIILTFGTSDVWLLKDTDRAVGNCHKHPASEFERRRVGIDETVELWSQIIAAVRTRNPEVKFILTVSPRRYLADGFAENSRQKAVLILACEKLSKSLPDVFYFPAYEIMNDDLRDYRFYAADLVHPNDSAIEYVWEKFCNAYLDADGLASLREMEKAAKRAAHRPIIT